MNLEWSAAPPKNSNMTMQQWYDTLPLMIMQCGDPCVVVVSKDVNCILENTHYYRPSLLLKGVGVLEIQDNKIFVNVSKLITRTEMLIVDCSGTSRTLHIKGIGI